MLKSFSNKSRKRILLAEDDAVMRRLVELQLDEAGYEVVSVEDGRQALIHLKMANLIW